VEIRFLFNKKLHLYFDKAMGKKSAKKQAFFLLRVGLYCDKLYDSEIFFR